MKVIINGQECQVPEGTNVLEACLSNGVNLEHFCYHRYLPVDGNCRTCMVEIETPRGPMLTIGCNTKVTEGMVVLTTSEKAARAQKSALEFLLLDHPLDCPICDKAGECKLQDHYMDFGRYEARRIVPRFFKGGKAGDVGEHIVLDQERCVLCTRCVRFLDNVPGSSELGIIRRGHEAKVTTFPGKTIKNDYSGNITDVCPVGALTLKEFRFKQRVWFLKKAKSVCQGCARGCTMTVEHNRGKVWRYMPRENSALNRVWMCDDGRFSFRRLEDNRLLNPLVKGQEKTFDDMGAALENLKSANRAQIGAIASPFSSLETLMSLKRFLGGISGGPGGAGSAGSNLAAWIPPATGKGDDLLKLPALYPNENGVKLLGISTDVAALLKRIDAGEIKILLVVEADLLGLEGQRFQSTLAKLDQLIVFSTKVDATSKAATLAVPVRNFAETNGTYVNATSLLQAARQAYEPTNGDRILAASVLIGGLAKHLGVDLRIPEPAFAFDLIAKEQAELAAYRFSTIPDTGIQLSLAPIGPAPFLNKKVDFNVFPAREGAKV